MVRNVILVVCMAGLATPAMAATAAKTEDCGLQGQVVSAVQQARLAKVSERKVNAHVLAGENTWPERYNNMIPLVSPWVYDQKRKDIAEKDLGAVWNDVCLAN